MVQRTAGRPDLGGSFSLVRSDGVAVTSEDLEGKWTLLYFGFTKCPDICPEEMHKVHTQVACIGCLQRSMRVRSHHMHGSRAHLDHLQRGLSVERTASGACVLGAPAQVSEVLTRLDGQGYPIQPVFITIDPHRDTKERLKSYFADGEFHPRFIALTGSDDQVKASSCMRPEASM